MQKVVRDAWVKFTDKLEDCIPYPYLDIKGLVTVGRGNLIDPIEEALKLPFMKGVFPTTLRALQGDIQAAWNLVHNRQDLAKEGGGHFKGLTNIWLPQKDIDDLTFKRLDEFDAKLAHRFPKYPEWPAPAQMACLSLCWACGEGWCIGPKPKFPRCSASLDRDDFVNAALEAEFGEEGNDSLKRRGKYQVIFFSLASGVVANNWDRTSLGFNPDKLYYV